MRWGCPAAGHAPPAALDPDLAYEARHVARVTGTPPATTCPLACLERASPWLLELTEAVSLCGPEGWVSDITDVLGRELTAADVAALSALKRGQSAAMQSDREIAEQREAERKQKK